MSDESGFYAESPFSECLFCGTLLFCGDSEIMQGGPACPCGGRHWLCRECNDEWDLFDPETARWRMCPRSEEIRLAAELAGRERPEDDPPSGDKRL